jgi:Uracil DNA glycosylase superfamily
MINKSFAEKIISFYGDVDFRGSLPPGIRIMNPFRNNPEILPVISKFYGKYYNDNKIRHLILGINPGRFGAGVTGIPFTDTIRLKEKCGIDLAGLKSFETSSVFIYEMIDRYGGPMKFYGDFYISSVSPLGFTAPGKGGKELNYNYYDNRELTKSIHDFAVGSIWKQIEFGIERDVCFCLGTGKNFRFLSELNNMQHFFKKIVPLEHPRFIMQYKSRAKQSYIESYLEKLTGIK